VELAHTRPSGAEICNPVISLETLREQNMTTDPWAAVWIRFISDSNVFYDLKWNQNLNNWNPGYLTVWQIFHFSSSLATSRGVNIAVNMYKVFIEFYFTFFTSPYIYFKGVVRSLVGNFGKSDRTRHQATRQRFWLVSRRCLVRISAGAHCSTGFRSSSR
jgi:hypothetical protein